MSPTEQPPTVELDDFTRSNTAAMRLRLDDGARKYGSLSWRQRVVG